MQQNLLKQASNWDVFKFYANLNSNKKKLVNFNSFLTTTHIIQLWTLDISAKKSKYYDFLIILKICIQKDLVII